MRRDWLHVLVREREAVLESARLSGACSRRARLHNKALKLARSAERVRGHSACTSRPRPGMLLAQLKAKDVSTPPVWLPRPAGSRRRSLASKRLSRTYVRFVYASRRRPETRQGTRHTRVDADPRRAKGTRRTRVDAILRRAKGRGAPESTPFPETPRDAGVPVDAIPGHAKGGGGPESTPSPDTPMDTAVPRRRYPETRQGTRRTRVDAILRRAKGRGLPEPTLSGERLERGDAWRGASRAR